MKTKVNLTGDKGRISAILQRPKLAEGQKCPLVILMHGFMSNKALQPLKGIAKALEVEGIASLRFDFDGHGRSEGRFQDMTVLTEIADAKAVWAYAESLDFVSKIALLGQSQGGVVAGMLAGELGASEVAALVQLSPAAVLKDDALSGVLMGKHYDPSNPPETLSVLFHKVGRGYFKVARTLPIYETSAKYDGPVCLIHGTDDRIVPYRYSEQYDAVYKDSVLHLLEGENHILSRQRGKVIVLSVEFLKDKLS